MLLVGSDDGVYAVTGLQTEGDTTARQVLDAGRVMRVRQFGSLDGVFAATKTGLCHTLDGETWIDLDVPLQKVYAVCAHLHDRHRDELAQTG